jgi:hypothetical protein
MYIDLGLVSKGLFKKKHIELNIIILDGLNTIVKEIFNMIFKNLGRSTRC